MATKTKIDRDFVRDVGGSVMAARLARHPDLAAVDNTGLGNIADMAVRAAIEVDAAIERAEDRLAEEAKAAEAAEAEKAKAEADKAKAEKAAAQPQIGLAKAS